MDQVLKNQVIRANPHILSHRFFFSSGKKKVFLHFLGFLCWDFFFPLPLASSVASGVDNSRKASLVRRHLPSLSSPDRLGLWPEQTGHPGRKPGWPHRLVGAGGGEASQETRVSQSAFILWETRPFGFLLSEHSSISWCQVWASPGFLGSNADIPDSQKPRARPRILGGGESRSLHT